MLEHLFQEFFPEQDAFDRRLGVRTAGLSSLFWRRLGRRKEFVHYQPVEENCFLKATARLPRWPFIDIGCGKGRALILAHEAGFHQLTGVDFSRKLCRAARRNLEYLGIGGKILCQDARRFVFPDVPTVVFMYNPFGERIMREVLSHLRDQPCFLVYVNPTHDELFKSFSLFNTGPMFKVYSVI